MDNVRAYGQTPYRVAVVHGGPGAAGEMAPVAKELAKLRGVLEPLQTKGSVEGQIEELKTVLKENAELPVTLIGHSWGAWLSLMFAARHPTFVAKLILVSCGPLEEKYTEKLLETRLKRLREKERAEFQAAIKALNDPTFQGKDAALARLGDLAGETDSYDPLPDAAIEPIHFGSGDMFDNVWKEASKLRKEGKLLECAGQVACPVTAIHGDYDPHPAEGVNEPLTHVLKAFRFILLPNCGHTPWLEKQAREAFYRVLNEELT